MPKIRNPGWRRLLLLNRSVIHHQVLMIILIIIINADLGIRWNHDQTLGRRFASSGCTTQRIVLMMMNRTMCSFCCIRRRNDSQRLGQNHMRWSSLLFFFVFFCYVKRIPGLRDWRFHILTVGTCGCQLGMMMMMMMMMIVVIIMDVLLVFGICCCWMQQHTAGVADKGIHQCHGWWRVWEYCSSLFRSGLVSRRRPPVESERCFATKRYSQWTAVWIFK